MSKLLKIGLPKGSLQEKTIEIFKKAGFNIDVNPRSYFPIIDDPEIYPVLIRAQEMSKYVEQGILDCGIVGEDWILENNSSVLRLGELMYAKRRFMPVRWVVAVKEDSHINKLEDLKNKRVATELVNYTKKFFREKKIPIKVEFSWGATEVKVKSGLVDAIVELTETGESLRNNNLREIATVCVSTTKFIANKESYKNLWKKKKMENILTLLYGVLTAVDKVGLKLNVHKDNLDKVLKILPALKKPTISSLTLDNWYALEVVVKEDEVRQLILKLKEVGAEGIIEYPLNKIIY